MTLELIEVSYHRTNGVVVLSNGKGSKEVGFGFVGIHLRDLVFGFWWSVDGCDLGVRSSDVWETHTHF